MRNVSCLFFVDDIIVFLYLFRQIGTRRGLLQSLADEVTCLVAFALEIEYPGIGVYIVGIVGNPFLIFKLCLNSV